MRSTFFFICIILCLTPFFGYSQLQHGEVLQDFRLFEPAKGEYFDLSQEYDHRILVLVFFAHECPYSKIYIERLIKTAKNYDPKDVFFVAIHPNITTQLEERLIEMNNYSARFPLPFAYLLDQSATLSKSLHVSKTPSVHVFKNINNKYVMEYRGAIDDAPEKEKQITEPYLQKAITALLANKSFKYRYTEPVGCVLK